MFSWWQYDFMRTALWAILLLVPLLAMLGTLVVNNGMSFSRMPWGIRLSPA